MSFAVVSDGTKWARKSRTGVSGNDAISVISDGAGNAYLDARNSYRLGLHEGPTMQLFAASGVTCDVYGTNSPAELATRPSTRNNTAMVFWGTKLVTLNPGDVFSATPKVFAAYKFVFNTGGGEVRLLTM